MNPCKRDINTWLRETGEGAGRNNTWLAERETKEGEGLKWCTRTVNTLCHDTVGCPTVIPRPGGWRRERKRLETAHLNSRHLVPWHCGGPSRTARPKVTEGKTGLRRHPCTFDTSCSDTVGVRPRGPADDGGGSRQEVAHQNSRHLVEGLCRTTVGC